tara:strand:- start:319 stop:600 length:282 start_codon:yes stop_codon:yes gene_type:complete
VKAIIEKIVVKLERLIEKHKKLQFESLELQKDNDALKASLEAKEAKIVSLQDKVKLMNISKSIDIDKQAKKATRLKINEYVREIDKCIALLNK